MPSPSGGNAGNFPMSPAGGEGTPIYIPTENVSVEGGLTLISPPAADSQPNNPGTTAPEPSSIVFFGSGLVLLGAYSGKLSDGRRKIVVLLRAGAERLH